MEILVNPDPREWGPLLSRPQIDRSVIGQRVADILASVKAGGDKALFELTRQIDGIELKSSSSRRTRSDRQRRTFLRN